MNPIIFVSLDAVMPGHLEPAFRSLMALQLYGLGARLSKTEQTKFLTPLAMDLMAIAGEYKACFAFTSLHTTDFDANLMRRHLNNLGLLGMASHLAENWSIRMPQSGSRADGIRDWLSEHASPYDAYVVIDTSAHAQEWSESARSQNVVIVDAENPDNKAGIELIRQVLGTGIARA